MHADSREKRRLLAVRQPLWWLLVSLCMQLALSGCALPGGSANASEGLEALQAARQKARTARYLVVIRTTRLDREGRRIHREQQVYGPSFNVFSHGGRVGLWRRGGVKYSFKRGRGCYERRTRFEQADFAEMRRDIVVAQAFVHEAELSESRGRTVIHWRGPVAERGYRVEGHVQLDRAGRPRFARERIVYLYDRAPSPWNERRYRYPSRFDPGSPPQPRCPTA